MKKIEDLVLDQQVSHSSTCFSSALKPWAHSRSFFLFSFSFFAFSATSLSARRSQGNTCRYQCRASPRESFQGRTVPHRGWAHAGKEQDREKEARENVHRHPTRVTKEPNSKSRESLHRGREKHAAETQVLDTPPSVFPGQSRPWKLRCCEERVHLTRIEGRGRKRKTRKQRKKVRKNGILYCT